MLREPYKIIQIKLLNILNNCKYLNKDNIISSKNFKINYNKNLITNNVWFKLIKILKLKFLILQWNVNFLNKWLMICNKLFNNYKKIKNVYKINFIDNIMLNSNNNNKL